MGRHQDDESPPGLSDSIVTGLQHSECVLVAHLDQGPQAVLHHHPFQVGDQNGFISSNYFPGYWLSLFRLEKP